MKRHMPIRKALLIGGGSTLLALVLLSVGKFVTYEAQSKLRLLREGVGRLRVVVPAGVWGLGPYEGTLTSVRYRLNDKLGFFDLEIGIRADSGWGGEGGPGWGGEGGLGPWELYKLEINEPTDTAPRSQNVPTPGYRPPDADV